MIFGSVPPAPTPDDVEPEKWPSPEYVAETPAPGASSLGAAAGTGVVAWASVAVPSAPSVAVPTGEPSTSNVTVPVGVPAAGATGFTPPLGPGSYTFLIQQTGALTNYEFDITVVPEPGSLCLMAIGGLLILAPTARKRRRKMLTTFD